MKISVLFIFVFVTLIGCGRKEVKPETSPLVVEEKSAPQAAPEAPEAPKVNPHAVRAPVVNPHAGMPTGHPPVPGKQRPTVNPHGNSQNLPAGHPSVPRAGQTATPNAVANAASLPLRPTGPGGAKELARVETQFSDGADRTLFQSAFKRVFTPNRQQRDPVGSTRDLRALAKKYPNAAPIYRVMGYAAVDNGFQTQLAFRMYNKAVELDPDYGEVHYALAFLYVMSDKATGAAHYKMALKLGVEDQRGIGQRFYPDLVQ